MFFYVNYLLKTIVLIIKFKIYNKNNKYNKYLKMQKKGIYQQKLKKCNKIITEIKNLHYVLKKIVDYKLILSTGNDENNIKYGCILIV